MKKNFFSILVVLVLVVILLVMNFTDIGEKQSTPNIIDVTGDTSVDGVTITGPNVKQLQEGETATNFTLPNLNDESINALNHNQEYVIVNFWATWCPPCIEELPDLQTFENQHPDLVKVIAVNVTETETSVSKVQNFVEEESFTFSVVLDGENAVYDRYSVINMPTSFIIRTSDQTIMKRINGAVSLEQLEQIFDELNT
ncbi:TlpA family protein disulfide reductase [Gracilibacillus kekensis]|uniref:Thiol-disulfide isomerase or thioredoxin n=1 Tax=Gracilibacillus kekensis TaxID=1027249 RepID=A0A1M7PK21_9BACI|nr:TlpA disulfide reductase family protein [Gracilibacillus kekensis]SHN17478.1 Thiol-disulfide isomerase or thioredoxin [Gracilibacillus kekensis]